MDGLEICARHAYIANKIQVCLKDKDPVVLYDFVITGTDNQVRDYLKQFPTMMPFLNLLSRKHSLDVFDKEVAEAYWLGNELLDNCQEADFRQIGPYNTPVTKYPGFFYLHHLFSVLYSVRKNFANPLIIDLINDCRVSWGKVISTGNNTAKIAYSPIEAKDGRLVLAQETEKEFDYDPKFTEIKKDDKVSMHLGMICMKLDNKQASNLEKYTKLILQRFFP